MKIIGITGGSGTGKTTVSKLFETCGIFRIDADGVARETVRPGEPALAEITERFGTDILLEDGSLNRKALAKTVFRDKNALSDLNAITHKYIIKRIERMIEECGAETVIVDAAALIESGLNERCDIVVSVTADFDTRKERIMARDSLDAESAAERINAQKDAEFYAKHSDFVIENNKDVYNLKAEIEKILRYLR